jgi:uncharacterized protein (TIGR02271 family)
MNDHTVVDRDGLRAVIEPQALDRGVEGKVLLRLPDGRQVLVPGEMLQREAEGHYRLAASLAELTAEPISATQAAAGEAGTATITLPVIEERARVEKRQVVTGRVRVTKLVREHEEVLDEPLFSEEVEVTRVPLDRWVDAPMSVRQAGDTLIIPVLEEVVVIEKRLRLKEEVHVTRRRRESRQPRRVVLRSEEVTVDREDAKG